MTDPQNETDGEEFRTNCEVYGEFRESIEELSVEPMNEAADEESLIRGVVGSALGVLVLAGGPYLLFGSWVAAGGALLGGYVLFASVRMRD